MKCKDIVITIIFNILIVTCAFSKNSSNFIDLNEWTSFFKKLDSCSVSTSKLPNPLKVLALEMDKNLTNFDPTDTYKILGWQNDKCHVKIISNVISSMPNTKTNFVTMNCLFSQDNLSLLIQSMKKQIQTKDFLASTDDLYTKVMNDSCSYSNI